jgi:hypothetical protein
MMSRSTEVLKLAKDTVDCLKAINADWHWVKLEVTLCIKCYEIAPTKQQQFACYIFHEMKGVLG